MDYFEEICKYLLEQENYWVRTCVKVEITKEEKKQLGKPSMPRPEIDIVAYKPKENLLILIEAKSFLNSAGVYIEHVQTIDKNYDGYKILTGKNYQEVVSKRLIEIYFNSGLISSKPRIQYGLIAGNVARGKGNEIRSFAKERDWFYWGPEELNEKLNRLKDYAYVNNPYVITSKLANKKMENEFKVTQINELTWVGKIDKKIICNFNYLKDSEGRFWINNISTIFDFQRNKELRCGTRMIKSAMEVYKKIYVSTADKIGFRAKTKYENDSRYTNDVSYLDSDLKKFVDKLIERGILYKDCERNPFE